MSLGILVSIDGVLGPAAFAVPPSPPEVVPSPAPPTASPAPASPTASASASTSASPSASASASASPSAEPTAAEPPSTPSPPTKYAGGRTNGVVATFEFEQANADLAALQSLAKAMHEDTVSEIVLEGHSDPSGNEYRNLSLSLDRANWAADRLVEYGINRMRIRTVGLGSARPIVDLGGDAGAINRRVEVRWVLRSADGGGR